MLDNMNGLKRTHYCGEVTEVGKDVVVGGFVQKIRDLGNLIFIDLRDKTGIVQLAFNEETERLIFEKASSCRSEFVLMARGQLLSVQVLIQKLKLVKLRYLFLTSVFFQKHILLHLKSKMKQKLMKNYA